MELAQCSDTRMMNVVVHDPSCEKEIERGIDAMGEGDQVPCRAKRILLSLFLIGLVVTRILPFASSDRAFDLLGRSQFDDVRNKEVTGDEKVKNAAIDDV